MDRVEDGSLDRQEQRVWRTSELHDIPIAEMDQRHLENICVWLDKRLKILDVQAFQGMVDQLRLVGDTDGYDPDDDDFDALEHEMFGDEKSYWERWVSIVQEELARRAAA